MHFCLIATFIPLRKEEKKKKRKNEETKPIFEGSYVGNARCDLVEMGGGDTSRHFHCKNCFVSLKCHGATYT